MKTIYTRVVAVFCLVTLNACKPAPEVVEPTANIDKPKATAINIAYEKFTLDNGLDVIFHVDRSDPVVAVSLTSHVGSARELPGRTGFAHLFEHLLFLESENLGKGGLDQLSARIGGSGANGFTSRDITAYFQTVPNDALEKMLWAEADKLGWFINTVTEPVLAKEKQVVKNEKRQSYDNRPYGHTQYVISKNLYPQDHPYNWQVIGSLDDLQAATLDDVKQFFKRWYVPNNVTLVVSGDFDTAQAKQWVNKYFDEIPRGEAVTPLPKTPVVLTETKKRIHEDNFAKLPELTLAWPTIPRGHKDSYALNMLVELLSEGKRAPFNKVLVDDKALTSDVSAYHYQAELAGQLMMSVRAFNDIDLDVVEKAINEAFTKFEQDGFSTDDLNRIKASMETSYYQGLTSVLGKAFRLADLNVFFDDPNRINQIVAEMQSVTADDINRVYNTYVKGQHFVATSFVPRGKPDLGLSGSIVAQVVEEKIVEGAEQNVDPSQQASYERTPSTFDRSIEPPYGESPQLTPPAVWRDSMTNGIQVLGIQSNEVPLVSVNFTMDGGLLFEKASESGLVNVTARLLNRGTRSKTPEQLEEAINQLGASINIRLVNTSIEVNVDTLARNYAATMALVTEMLLEPRWDDAELALVKQEVISDIQQSEASPIMLANMAFAKQAYPASHPLSRPSQGTEESVTALTMVQLKSYYENYVVPNMTSVHVVGDVSKDAVMQSLANIEKKWESRALTLPELPAPIEIKTSQLYFYDVPGAKQSVLEIGHVSMNATSDDFFVANVANYSLGGGGFASQLMQQLRETKGYTYGIRSRFYGGKHWGRYTISTSVRSNVTFESLQEIKHIVENYAANYTDRELATTQSYYVKSYAREFETMDAKIDMLQSISQLSYRSDYANQHIQQVQALTVDSVKQLATQFIKPQNMIYVVVGDAETQLEKLSRLGLGEPIKLN
ncbi:insulinase family protein [Alteromonas sediminis]|uniref:Insulinase family protein n=1 Tax=Alteromonas sediminis TaxID=2259342 RepID=A0A3N5XZR5_9ALTE|nr:pitrilysin family protein [Alteromonas sediminis]RPJ66652.1 insulinase family protein [Alteromonas sediminis]